MNYDEACECELTRTEAENFIREHDIGDQDSFDDFYDVCGFKALYKGIDVLNWLGY